MKNLQDLMSHFGGGEPDPTEQRIEEIKQQLHTDYAIKSYQEVDRFIKQLAGDINAQYEAQAFVRVYLRKAVYLAKEVAQTVHLPEQLAFILAHKIEPMVAHSLEDFYNDMMDDPNFTETLEQNSKQTPLLSDGERSALTSELHKLLEQHYRDQEEVPEVEQVPAPEPPAGIGEMYGHLDPKNPFGLNQ